MALLKNHAGEYNYQFNWKDENGYYCGFNDVWAKNKRAALKKARAMETEAGWRIYDPVMQQYVPTKEPQHKHAKHCFYHKGMYVAVETMYRATAAQRDHMDKLGWMMTC